MGIDIGKEVHWACAVDDARAAAGQPPLDNDPVALGGLHRGPGGLRAAPVLRVGLDVVGGIAWLAPHADRGGFGWSASRGWRSTAPGRAPPVASTRATPATRR